MNECQCSISRIFFSYPDLWLQSHTIHKMSIPTAGAESSNPRETQCFPSFCGRCQTKNRNIDNPGHLCEEPTRHLAWIWSLARPGFYKLALLPHTVQMVFPLFRMLFLNHGLGMVSNSSALGGLCSFAMTVVLFPLVYRRVAFIVVCVLRTLPHLPLLIPSSLPRWGRTFLRKINSFKKNFLIWIQPQSAFSHRFRAQKGQAMFRSLSTHMAKKKGKKKASQISRKMGSWNKWANSQKFSALGFWMFGVGRESEF